MRSIAQLLLLGLAAAAASDLKAEAQRCASAMLGTDAKAAVACMNPRLVAALGGPESAERTLARKLKEMEERGAKFEDVTIGEPHEPIVLNGREFALLPETLHIRVKEGLLRQEAFMLAVREKDAKNWTFFDAAPSLPKALATLFTDTPESEFDKLKIPDRQPLVLEK